MFEEHAVKNMRTSRTDGETSGLIKLIVYLEMLIYKNILDDK